MHNVAKTLHENKTGSKICVFSKHLHWLDLQGMAETAAEIGFDGVDLTVRPGGHVLPEKVEDDLPRAAEACQKAGIDIVMLCTAIRDASDPTTEKILNTAGRLGIRHYRMAWYHYDDKTGIEENLLSFKARMKELAAMNEHYRIKGDYQNHDGTWFGAPVWDLGTVLREIDSGWLGSQYDILNATLEGVKSWPLGLEYVAPYIHTIDIKDAQLRKQDGRWSPRYTPLGEGDVDFEAFFKLLRKLDIHAPFSMHFEYDLGGADVGARRLTMPAEQVVAAMKKDLKRLREFIA